jgi:hypothetical protein
VGAKVSPESFPAGTLRVVAGPGRLRPLAIDGPLGLTPVREAFWDRRLETVCRVFDEVSKGDPRRCEPLMHAVNGAYFADAACTIPVVAVNACRAARRFARLLVYNSPGGGVYTTIYRVGDEHHGPIFDRSEGPCGPVTPEAGQRLLRVQKVDPETTFAQVELAVDP